VAAVPELSIVMPCFNEAEGIEARVREWIAAVGAVTDQFEVVIINDGSSDGSGRVLDRLRKEFRCIRLHHQLNGGHARAVRRGYELARGRFVLQVDSNGAYPAGEWLAFWEKRNGFELILGSRDLWLRGRARRALSGMLRWWVGLLFGSQLTDPNVPFRLFRRETAMAYLPSLPPDYEGVNLALSLLIQRDYPLGVVEIALPAAQPIPGRFPKPLWAFAGFVLHFLLEVTQLRFSRRFAPPLVGPLVDNLSN
jgi:glycosyltransferase involved in cell wall biosynthesis